MRVNTLSKAALARAARYQAAATVWAAALDQYRADPTNVALAEAVRVAGVAMERLV